MRSTNFAPLDLSDYEISPEQGFLPKDPLENLPDLPTLTHLGHELPKLLSARTVRRFIDEQRHAASFHPSNMAHRGLSGRDADSFVCRACLRVGSAGPTGCDLATTIGETLARSCASGLAVLRCSPTPPMRSTIGGDSILTKPIQLDNIVLLQNFLGGLDEEWFVVVHIQIEREAGSGLAGLLRAMNGAAEDKEDEVLLGLSILGVGPNGDARHVAQDERTLRSLRVLQPRAALYPRLEEQPYATERALLRGRRGPSRAAATIPRRNRRAKLHCALSRRRTRDRPCA